MKKYYYIEVRTVPSNMGKTVARVDVSHLNKKGKEAEWDRLDAKYPPGDYQSCLTDVKQDFEPQYFEK